MAWQISFTPAAQKHLGKIDRQDAKKIMAFLKLRVLPDQKGLGGSLKGQLHEFWRWRVGPYRILAKIEEDQLLVLVVSVGHRSKIYDGH